MAVSQLVLAGALGLVGEWGRRNAPALARTAQDGEHKVVVLRRGALGCEVVAALFALAAVAELI
ncbi:hypothetical protein LWP59_08775 [Amycolatopsis acidiphila]|uniref:Uncharacterized protein n=1 Tax=Amycolatopsis acidiphila TaxID=715473 RepID=A0A558A4Y8_9PSEU|nr:hypothetical protein [Amycolatopsis acidiphila]TVT19334.1 hypothetical protein FNH06_24560 [Amycolatopsis acidiphila]UIJ61698.1 hypothetical protein LWP59_08775 [Amycolatopsis acidiphila]